MPTRAPTRRLTVALGITHRWRFAVNAAVTFNDFIVERVEPLIEN